MSARVPCRDLHAPIVMVVNLLAATTLEAR